MDTTASSTRATPPRTEADASGLLDEALDRIHRTGPEHHGHLSNHAPMVVEALASHGGAERVHGWLDRYVSRMEEMPRGIAPLTEAQALEVLGDPRRVADLTRLFVRLLDEEPWQQVLVRWWPRLLPGLSASATHSVIRTGHAVRALVERGPSPTRLAELAHALGYWAARWLALPEVEPLQAAPGALASLDAVPLVRQTAGFSARLATVRQLPAWAAGVSGPEEARRGLDELVTAATHRYATHGHGEAVMMVHAATAPQAVRRVLPVLPQELWVPSLRAAWSVSAACTAMYAAAEAEPVSEAEPSGAEEITARALAHGDPHVIKFLDTALTVGDPLALRAAARAVELGEPLDAE